MTVIGYLTNEVRIAPSWEYALLRLENSQGLKPCSKSNEAEDMKDAQNVTREQFVPDGLTSQIGGRLI